MRVDSFPSVLKFLVMLGVVVTLTSGCQGGGGGGSSADGSNTGAGSGGGNTGSNGSAPPPSDDSSNPPPPDKNPGGGDPGQITDDTDTGVDSTVEPPTSFHAQSAALLTKAYIKHAEGYRGFGALVALIDTGISLTIPDIESRISPDSTCVICGQNIVDTHGHGTAMASLIASSGKGTKVRGMAPDAELLVIRADTDEDRGHFRSRDIINAIDLAIEQGADVINLSLGGQRSSGVERAIKRAVDRDVIVVMALGNDGKTVKPDNFAAQVGSYGPTAIAVTAVDENNELADFAQPCDVVNPRYCLAAPGVRVAVIMLNGNAKYSSGTSVSTAIVSGAMALMHQYFPNLSGAEIVEIILTTAKDLGAPGVDRVYGSGLLDIVAAMQPLGTLTVSALNEVTLDESSAIIAMTSGDSFLKVAAFESIEITDVFRRRYLANLSTGLRPQKNRFENADMLSDMFARDFRTQLNDLTFRYTSLDANRSYNRDAAWRFGFSSHSNSATSWGLIFSSGDMFTSDEYGYLKFTSQNLSRGLFDAERETTARFTFGSQLPLARLEVNAEHYETKDASSQNTELNVGLTFGRADTIQPYLGFSFARENGSFFQTRFSGAFGSIDNTSSAAVTVGLTYQNDQFDLFASSTHGRASVNMREAGLINEIDNVSFSSWRFGGGIDTMFTTSDRLEFGITQPLRLNRADLTAYDGSQTRVSPSGRQITAELAYRNSWSRSDLGVALAWVHDRNHMRSVGAEWRADFMIRHRF